MPPYDRSKHWQINDDILPRPALLALDASCLEGVCMLKFILRALFQPSYRHGPKRKKTPFNETVAYKSGRALTGAPKPRTPPHAPAPTRREVFDRTTAHTADVLRVIEGPAYVTDGDTITIQKTQIRLYGIDAPELDHPYGKKAKWAMVRLCKGHKIRAEVTEEDDYGRTVAKCFLPDGHDLSAELVEQGLALDWPKFSGGKYSHLEVAGVRKKLWLADARQKGRMDVWEKFEARKLGEKG